MEKNVWGGMSNVEEVLTVKRIDYWSEFRSNIFSGVQRKSLGTLAINICITSGSLHAAVSHEVRSWSASIKYVLKSVKL